MQVSKPFDFHIEKVKSMDLPDFWDPVEASVYVRSLEQTEYWVEP